MSSDSLALFRKSLGPDLAALAEQHLQHDLTPSDRTALQSAASTVSTYTTLGSALGLALSLTLAYRLRRNRQAIFSAFRTSSQPTALKFANGREEAIPDLTPLIRPSRLGDVATYTFLGLGGVFFGGELGLLGGTFRARQVIGGHRESRERIEAGFRRFRADVLRKQADALDERREGPWGRL